MKHLEKIQKEINLLVKQAEIVARLEESRLKYHENSDMLNSIDEKLNQIYPSYLELRKKYLTE